MVEYKKKYNLERQDIAVLDLTNLKNIEKQEEAEYLKEYLDICQKNHVSKSKKKKGKSRSNSREMIYGTVFDQIDDRYNPYSDGMS